MQFGTNIFKMTIGFTPSVKSQASNEPGNWRVLASSPDPVESGSLMILGWKVGDNNLSFTQNKIPNFSSTVEA